MNQKSQKILKYTKHEGDKWIIPAGEGITEYEVLSLPLIHHYQKGYLWGYIHSYIREDGKRLDAFNDGFLIGRKVVDEI